jgi:hypothetical protein
MAAMAIFAFDFGISTDLNSALCPFRIRVSMSAMGSISAMDLSPSYQLDLRTPGNSPAKDMFLKQMRQIPNFLRKARERPQSGHRL